MNLNSWLGQSTTGAGFATLLATAGSVAAGSLSWQSAVPLLVGGLVGLIWPENSGLQSAAGSTAATLENLITTYQSNLSNQKGSPFPTAGQQSGTSAPTT